MKKKIFPVLFTMFATSVFAQQKDDVFYIFKDDWSPAKDMKECVYFMQPVKENDSTFICRYYQKFGPMIKQESYSDSDFTVPNGDFFWFNTKGKPDSSGYVAGGKKDGRWFIYGDSAKPRIEKDYDNGKLVKTFNLEEKKEYYPDGTVKDIPEQKDTSGVTHVMVQAKYPGGSSAWQKYLMKNMQVPDRFNDIIHNGACTVIVGFVVDKEGKVDDVEILQSCEWSADAEALRVIKKGGDWLPASIDGRKVLYRQKQSLTFSVN